MGPGATLAMDLAPQQVTAAGGQRLARRGLENNGGFAFHCGFG